MLRQATSGALCAALLCGCFDGPREAVEAAIAAASAEDEEAMLEHLDERSSELVERVRSEGRDVPDRWRWMRGRPTALLANLRVSGVEEIGDHTAKVSLEGSAIRLREVWVLNGGSRFRPKWRVHLPGSSAIYDRLRLEGD